MARQAPQPPIDYGDTVKVKLADGTLHLGIVKFVGWLPFPGAWSWDVKVMAGALIGETVKCHGLSEHPNIRVITNDASEDI